MPSLMIGDIVIGSDSDRLAVIAGPCVIESLDLCRQVASAAKQMCSRLHLNYIFKASFDKANRTSAASFRGPGLERGLEILATIRSEFGVPVLTDIHEAWQAKPAADVVDILQIPAFLCRQTDLLVAAAETGRCINIKKGQFLAPWDMRNAIEKVRAAGNPSVFVTERGVSFGYNTLVVDMCALPQIRAMGVPVCFDATHSVQQPGAAGTQSGGRREFVPHLARAAAAVGIDALFLEVHPEPAKGLSDAATMWPLGDLEELLGQVQAVDTAVRGAGCR